MVHYPCWRVNVWPMSARTRAIQPCACNNPTILTASTCSPHACTPAARSVTIATSHDTRIPKLFKPSKPAEQIYDGVSSRAVAAPLMSALSSAYWSDRCATSFDRRTVSQFQRILYPVGGTTVSALVCTEGDAFIYLASPCLDALALNHRPSHIHSHPNVYMPARTSRHSCCRRSSSSFSQP